MSRQRSALWDNLRFFLIFCVVLAHFLSKNSDLINAKRVIFFIYLYHMPCFMFVSGLFSKRIIRERDYRRIFRMLMAFFATKLILFSIRSIVKGRPVSLSFSDISDVSWYVFVLFVFYLMCIFLSRFSAVYIFIASVILSCCAGYIPGINTFFSLSRIITFFPFFWAGYQIFAGDLLGMVRKPIFRVSGIAVLILTALIVYFNIESLYKRLQILKGKVPYMKAGLGALEDYGGLIRILWYLVAFILIAALISVVPQKRFFFSVWGSRTLAVYMLHYIPLTLYRGPLHGFSWIQRNLPGYPVCIVACIALAVTVVLSLPPFTAFVNILIDPGVYKENDQEVK